jgi:hypothetical protein
MLDVSSDEEMIIQNLVFPWVFQPFSKVSPHIHSSWKTLSDNTSLMLANTLQNHNNSGFITKNVV